MDVQLYTFVFVTLYEFACTYADFSSFLNVSVPTRIQRTVS